MVYTLCVPQDVCQCVKTENLFLFQLVGVPALFAGLLCVGGVWVEFGH